MTFISKNSRVFLNQIPDDWPMVIQNAGKLRNFEDGMDGRCWASDCFGRHSYLLELLLGKWNKFTDDDTDAGTTDSHQERSDRSQAVEREGTEAEDSKKERPLSSGDGPLSNQGLNKDPTENTRLGVSRSRKGELRPNQTRSVTVDVTGGQLRRQISVAISCCNLSTNSYESTDEDRCHCNPDVVYLHTKLTRVMNENDILHKKLYAMEQTKSAYIYKIEGDLERYCQLCQKQKESILALKGELRYMEEQVASLQEYVCECKRPSVRNCACGREH